MSASDADSSIFLSDTDNQIKKKIGQAFSGGQDTRELHREIGGRTKVDVPFQYLTFFMEDDDELERIRVAYEKGEMESGGMKAACTKEMQEYVRAFRERRKKVTEEVRREFMTPRQLVFRGMPAESDRIDTIAMKIRNLEEKREGNQNKIRICDEEIRKLREENKMLREKS